MTIEHRVAPNPKLLSLNEWRGEDKPEGYTNWLTYISNKIRELRKERGLNQIELAEATGLPQSHISRLEGGVHSPSHKTLKKLAKAFDVDVSELDPSL